MDTNMGKLSLVEQSEHSECGIACITMILNYWGIKSTLNEIRDHYGVPRGGLSLYNLIEIISDHGIKGKAYKINSNDLISSKIKHPIIILWNNNHFVVVKSIKNKVTLFDPDKGILKVSKMEFEESFSQVILSFEPTDMIIDTWKKQKQSHVETLQKIIMNFFVKQKKSLIFLLVSMIILQLFSIIVPTFIRLLIDGNNVVRSLLQRTLLIVPGFIIIFIIYTLMQFLNDLLLAELKYNFNGKMIDKLIKKISEIQFKYFINRASGDWIYRANLISYIQQLLSQQFLKSIIEIILVVVYLFIMYSYSPILTFITVGIGAIIIFSSLFYTKMLFNFNSKEMILQNQTQNIIIELFEGMETIKSLNLENIFLKRWSEKFKLERDLTLKKDIKISVLGSFISSIYYFTPIILILIGTTLIYGQGVFSITLGKLIGFITLSQSFLSPLNGVMSTFIQMTVIKIQFKKINEIFAINSTKHLNSDTHMLERIDHIDSYRLENISFKHSIFDGLILNNINLSIDKNDKIAVVGSSGSGKSTLLKILDNLLEPTEGEIYINNLTIDKYSREAIKDAIGMVNQNPIIFNESILYNITLGEENYDPDFLQRVICDSTLDTLIKELPMGLSTTISDQGMNLSGGQKQKIILARILFRNTKMLLLDEPTSALDSLSETKIIDNLLKKSIPCILVSHKANLVKRFDKIIVISSGTIMECGNHESLIKKQGIYAEMFAAEKE